MKVTKAVITAAAAQQRSLPHQTLIDSDGIQKSVLSIIVSKAVNAGIQEVCIVIPPGDEDAFRQSAGEYAQNLRFAVQDSPRGYGDAIFRSADFVGDEPFLHMIGDHLYVLPDSANPVKELIHIAELNSCSVSGVQATRENLLSYFGAISGQRIKGEKKLYTIESVIEKPTPTQAEQTLRTPGIRTGHYLCFFGLHVFTPTIFSLLSDAKKENPISLDLSPSLDRLARIEKYLALETTGQRCILDVKYGLLNAQLALALSGDDRDLVLTNILELLAQRDLANATGVLV
jgi:UTP--glucose-1-phosphate uridylyltransferase